MQCMTFMSDRAAWVAFPSVLQGLRLTRVSTAGVLVSTEDPIADLGDITAFAALLKVSGGSIDRLAIASPYPSRAWMGCLAAEGIHTIFYAPRGSDLHGRPLGPSALVEVPRDLCPALHVGRFAAPRPGGKGCPQWRWWALSSPAWTLSTPEGRSLSSSRRVSRSCSSIRSGSSTRFLAGWTTLRSPHRLGPRWSCAAALETVASRSRLPTGAQGWRSSAASPRFTGGRPSRRIGARWCRLQDPAPAPRAAPRQASRCRGPGVEGRA